MDLISDGLETKAGAGSDIAALFAEFSNAFEEFKATKERSDAFAAGIILGLHEGWPVAEMTAAGFQVARVPPLRGRHLVEELDLPPWPEEGPAARTVLPARTPVPSAAPELRSLRGVRRGPRQQRQRGHQGQDQQGAWGLHGMTLPARKGREVNGSVEPSVPGRATLPSMARHYYLRRAGLCRLPIGMV